MSAASALSARPTARPLGLSLLTGFGALCLLLSVGVQGAMLTAPLLTMHIFDGVLETRNLGTLSVLAFAFVVAQLLGAVLRFLRESLLAALSERLGRRLQLRALVAAVRAALLGERTRGAEALQDVAEVRRLLGGTFIANLLDTLTIPAALVFLYMLHPLLFAIALVACMLKALLGALSDLTTRRMVAEANSATTRAQGGLIGWLRQQDALLGLGMLPTVLRRWAPGHIAAVEQQDAVQRRAAALQGLMQLVMFMQQVAIAAAGAWLLTRNRASPGVMLAAFMLVGLVTHPAAQLVHQWRDWVYGTAAWRRLTALVRHTVSPEPLPTEPGALPGLVIEDVTLQPPGATRSLLVGLNLHLPPGQAWAVLGANGVGKTTLLRAILGLVAPAGGRVLLDGQDTHRADRGRLGPCIGYLPQDPQLLEGSVLENIDRFAGGPTAEAVEAARRVGAHDAIGRLLHGYETPAGPSSGLSGGQLRLVALARAFHGRPRLLVLDEPEAGLDASAQAGLRAAVAAAKAEGAVVVLATHQPMPWAEVLDGVLRLSPTGTWRADRKPRPAVPPTSTAREVMA